MHQYSHHGGARRRREQEIENLSEEMMIDNFPNQDAQSPKQDEPKEALTHHNKNAKG